MTTTAENPGDEAYARAVALVREHDKASTSWLQRQLAIGYNSAALLIEHMEQAGVVSAPDHVGRRTVLDASGKPTKLIRPAPATQMSIPVELPDSRRNVDDRLRLLIERIERLEEEKKGVGDDIRDVYNEGKAVGYDVKMMRAIVSLRKMKPDDRREMEMLLDTYKSALGLD